MILQIFSISFSTNSDFMFSALTVSGSHLIMCIGIVKCNWSTYLRIVKQRSMAGIKSMSQKVPRYLLLTPLLLPQAQAREGNQRAEVARRVGNGHTNLVIPADFPNKHHSELCFLLTEFPPLIAEISLRILQKFQFTHVFHQSYSVKTSCWIDKKPFLCSWFDAWTTMKTRQISKNE